MHATSRLGHAFITGANPFVGNALEEKTNGTQRKHCQEPKGPPGNDGHIQRVSLRCRWDTAGAAIGVNVPGLAPVGRFSGDTHWPVLTDR